LREENSSEIGWLHRAAFRIINSTPQFGATAETDKSDFMLVKSEPAILYFGTAVVLVSTINEDGSYNVAPMSSAFWLGWRCVLGLAAVSQTPKNMLRTRECVLNLASADNVEAVNRLARTTGTDPVPEVKVQRGYRYVREKFEQAELTPVLSTLIRQIKTRSPVSICGRPPQSGRFPTPIVSKAGSMLTYEPSRDG